MSSTELTRTHLKVAMEFTSAGKFTSWSSPKHKENPINQNDIYINIDHHEKKKISSHIIKKWYSILKQYISTSKRVKKKELITVRVSIWTSHFLEFWKTKKEKRKINSTCWGRRIGEVFSWPLRVLVVMSLFMMKLKVLLRNSCSRKLLLASSVDRNPSAFDVGLAVKPFALTASPASHVHTLLLCLVPTVLASWSHYHSSFSSSLHHLNLIVAS